MPIDNEKFGIYIAELERHLQSAFNVTKMMQIDVQKVEGDSDLFRKFAMYLTPNLDHWINGLQAGNVKDLKEVLSQRTAPPKVEEKTKKK